jgi:hypothetical protein
MESDSRKAFSVRPIGKCFHGRRSILESHFSLTLQNGIMPILCWIAKWYSDDWGELW